jgi:hypothetical protein
MDVATTVCSDATGLQALLAVRVCRPPVELAGLGVGREEVAEDGKRGELADFHSHESTCGG